MSLWDEILSQPQVLDDFMVRRWTDVQALTNWISAVEFSYVVIAARGSSDNAARYAQYLWGAQNRLNVSLAAPSLYTLFDSPPALDHALVVGVSQSGESPDLLAVLRSARDQGRPTVAITNNANSPMASLTDQHLDVTAGREQAVAATKTYTNQLMAIAALSASMTGDPKLSPSLGDVSSAVAEVLEARHLIEPAVETLVGEERCVVLGRGFNHATAFEWALKVAELSYIAAQPFSAADFRHGPLAMVEGGLVVLAVATAGPLFDDVADLLEVCRERGATVVAISDNPGCPADHLIPLPGGLPPWLTPIPATVAAQVFTYLLTVARGQDPDNPRSLEKVTKTV